MIPLNYHHLYYFYVVATEGSIVKAKEKLLLAQPTISGQLRELESQLGRPLFERKKQRLHLTEEGRFVLGYAQRIFDLGMEMADSLKDRPPEGRLRAQIGLVTGTPRAIAQTLVDHLFAAFPQAHLTVREDNLGDLEEELRAHRLDLILSDTPPSGEADEEFISRLAGRVPVALAAAPKLARRLGPLPQALDGAPMILPAQPSQVYHQLLDLFARWKVKPDVVAEVQDVELARRLAVAGRGVVPLNRETLKDRHSAGMLVALPSKPLGVHESVYLIARQRRWLNPLAERALNSFRL
ncbi:MAG: LysR family transcriptional regulator [Elusimicrobia bacterium]|nr:LysR family transcriptional regulator [Elusimicrobiota bacterium]